MTEKERLDWLTEQIIGAAIEVHRRLGPGLLESAYEACLVYELARRGIVAERQKPVRLTYDGMLVDCGYRMDVFVAGDVVLELKAVERIHPIDKAQLLTHLKLADRKVGLLINFNVLVLKDGICRMVNGYPER